MSGFKVTSKVDNDNKPLLLIDGSMDEHSDYSVIDANLSGDVTIDFNNVEHINSTGIKHWVQWTSKTKEANPGIRFYFINCPKPIVDQINMVDGFLPAGSTVKSFKVPYYCETCDKDLTMTFAIGKEYNIVDGKCTLQVPDKTCEKDDCEMEPDVVEQKYFKFLK